MCALDTNHVVIRSLLGIKANRQRTGDAPPDRCDHHVGESSGVVGQSRGASRDDSRLLADHALLSLRDDRQNGLEGDRLSSVDSL